MRYNDLHKKNMCNKTCTVLFQQDVAELCKPLINLGIYNVNYLKYSRDRKEFILFTNNPEYPRIYFENDGILLDPYVSLETELPPGLYTNVWQRGFQTNTAKNLLAKLDKHYYLKDGCALIRNTNEGERTIYYFSAHTSTMITCYEALDIFTHYFEDKISKIVSMAEPIVLPNKKTFWRTLPVKNLFSESINNIDEFLKKINFIYYKCLQIAQQYRLSRRELQCLFLLLQKKSTKQIAQKLGIAQRTTEHYIENIKLKLNCKTKLDIIIETCTTIPWVSLENTNPLSI